jgi:hypothetical protein
LFGAGDSAHGSLIFSADVVNNSRVMRTAALIALTCAGLVAAYGEFLSSVQPQQPAARPYSSGEPRKPVAAVSEAPSPVTFTNIAASSGITFKHAACSTSQKYLLETMGGGVALLDCDNDGRLDLFFTNGASLDDPMPKDAVPDKREPRFWNRLYRQRTDGGFEDVTERAGLKGEGYSMGVAAGDYDNDGFTDLYVTAYGGNNLYRNNGDGTFADVTRRAGVAGSGWSTSAAWIDYDRDGRLDLFVARYLDWDFGSGSLYCGEQRPGFRAYCHPDNFKGAANLLFRQRPDGAFEDVSAQSRIADRNGKALGVAVTDIDGDGWPDLAVANDSVRQSLYHNLRDGTFEDIALPAGVAYDENARTFAGMGVDAADYDGDGHPDILITALSNETYPLFRNSGDGTFTYETNTTGLGQATLLYSGWGTRFVDVDNDGLLDIFVAQGHVLDTVEKNSSYLKYKQTPLLMRNTGKGFITVSGSAGEPFKLPVAARGSSVGDLNNDGYADIVLAVLDGPPIVLRNNGTRNHWVGFRLVGSKSNRDGLGARLIVSDSGGRRRVFDVTTSGSYLSSSDRRVLVGLGAATSLRSVEVRWPNGRVQSLAAPEIDRYYVITEGQ